MKSWGQHSMNEYVKELNKDSRLGSRAWANETLRWIIGFLKEDSWNSRPYYKVIVAKACAEDLKVHGFHWQSRRVLNHLFLYLKNRKVDISVSVACTRADLDPVGRARDLSKRREVS